MGGRTRYEGDGAMELRELPQAPAEVIEKKSAKSPGRVIFGEMLKRIEKGETDGASHRQRKSPPKADEFCSGARERT